MTIKKFKGYDQIKGFGQSTNVLPRGGYIVTIKDVEKANNSRGVYYKISYDIAEGNQKDFFLINYENQDREDKRWKGQFFVNDPKDDETPRDYYVKRRFVAMTTAFEESNPGYVFDWEEKHFIGLKVGLLVNHKEIEFDNGRTAMVANVAKVCSVSQIRSGKYNIPNDIMLEKKKPEPSDDDLDPFLPVPSDEELPF